MSIQAATPYLHLPGRVKNAIELYTRAFGAKVEMLQRFGDVDRSCPEAQRELVMHAELRVGSARLMMSDAPPREPVSTAGTANMSIALEFSDPAQLRRSFDALATTGQVIERVFEAPWGGLFGVLRDEFGISWMFTTSTAQKP